MKYYPNNIAGVTKNWIIFILLFLILFIAYLPLSSFYFGMKNDAFSDNFPNKFFLSEAIHSGMSPLWNPYMNFGFPVYADMGFAFWNPITWIFAGIGYNAYTLTCEVLFYLFIAGTSMFYLGSYLKFSAKISLALACMYMCSGFFTGCLQYINFITAASFLPAALLALLRLLEQPCIKNSFLLAVAWYMVVAGGHPAIPVGFGYFTIIFLVTFLLKNKEYWGNIKTILLYTAVALLLLLIFYLPAIYSYLNIIPYYARNHAVTEAAQVNTGFTAASFISFVSPFFTAFSKNIFGADVAMRNAYFSISGLLLMLICCTYKNKYVVPVVFTALFSLLISSGGFVYNLLPLLSFIRTNGEFRIFSILGFCILSAFGLKALFTGDEKTTRFYRRLLYAVLAVTSTVFIYVLIAENKTIIHDIHNITAAISLAEKIKSFLDGSVQMFLFASTAITILVILFSIFALKSHRQNFIIGIIIFDLVVNSLVYLPITGVGQVTLCSIQSVYDNTPKGMPIPTLAPINQIKIMDSKTTGLTGDISYYNKKIGTTYLTDYPSYFISTDAFFKSTVKDSIFKRPFLFLKSNPDTDSVADITVTKFAPCDWSVVVQSANEDSLVFLQNHYKYWKAYNNNKEVPVTKSYITFISIAVHKGQNDIRFVYRDNWLYVMITISVVSFIICLFLFFYKWKHASAARLQ